MCVGSVLFPSREGKHPSRALDPVKPGVGRIDAGVLRAVMSAQVLPGAGHVRQLLLVSGGGLEMRELACLLQLDSQALTRVLEQGQQRGQVLLVNREQPQLSGPRLLEGPSKQQPPAVEQVVLALSAVQLCRERP